MAAQKVWKGLLKWQKLLIPVFLNTGARDKGVELHKYHSCGSNIKMPTTCPACARTVTSDEVHKGYDTGSGHVPLTAEELDSIAPETEKVMEITDFVKAEEVDPIYMAESFYLLPDPAGKDIYSLLAQTLKSTDRVAIGQLTKSGRENIVLIRPRGNGLMLHYLYYADEVNENPEFEALNQMPLKSDWLKSAKQLAEQMAQPFAPDQFENGYAMRLNQLIQSKMDKTVKAPTPVKTTAVASSSDLGDLLTASLTQRTKRKIALADDDMPKKAAPAKKRKAA